MTSFILEYLQLMGYKPKRDYHYIEVSSGEFMDFDSPDFSKIEIDDIAHGLSNTCRFTGHTNIYYSVAQHSLLVESIVAEAGGTTLERFQALMHDAPEAFLSDIPTPLKDLLPDYQKMEDHIASAIGETYEVDILNLPDIVAEADERALHIEANQLMPKAEWAPNVEFKRGIPGVSDPDGKLVMIHPALGKEQFLGTYWNLKVELDKENNVNKGT